MKKLIYSKYSNDRNTNYKIRTDILEDEAKQRYVQKTGTTLESEAHIQKIYENYLKLTKTFEQTKFTLNTCKKLETGIEFEYIEGKTYEVYLDELLENEAYDDLIKAIQAFVDEIKKAAIEPFYVTDSYVEMFGDGMCDTSKKALPISDIDMIFPNIIIRNEMWEVIDYEWSYHIPIPVDFVIYRALHYYEAGQRHERLKEICNIFRFFGISKEEQNIYEQMEKNFQNFLLKDNVPLWQLYDGMKQNIYFPGAKIEEERLENNNKRIHILQIFEDDSKNVDYFIQPIPNEMGRVCFDIELNDNIKTLVIQPALRSCVVALHGFRAEGFGVKQLDFISNAYTSDNKLLYFTSNAPHMLLGDFDMDKRRVHVEMSISYMNTEIMTMAATHIDKLNKSIQTIAQKEAEIGSFVAQNSEKENEIVALNINADAMNERNNQLLESLNQAKGDVEHLNQIIHQMEGSLSWKITKPIRKILGILHR